jgi:hypothetical protein
VGKSLNLCFAVEVNAGAEGGLDENIIEGQLGKSVCENIDLCGHVEAVIENQALFAAHDTQTTGTTHEVFAEEGDIQAMGKGFKFL